MTRLAHGHTVGGKRSSTHESWRAMIARCTNPNNNRYYAYGAKGVKVCSRWLKFENFLEDMGERPANTTLGRHCDKGNYEPGNVSWQTNAEQVRKGSRNPKAKLTEVNVLVARALVEKGSTKKCTIRNMAAELGVSEPALSEAVNGKTWKHV